VTPDQWSALRDRITADRAAFDEQANDHSEMGGPAHQWQAERLWGRVAQCDALLAFMAGLDGGR
jgi:hypothetical protein